MTLKNKNGFTFIELFMVMAVAAVLAVFAIASIGNPRGYQAVAESEALKANLRFTQSKAMRDLPGNIWALNITAANYTINRNGGVPSPAVNLPGANSGTYTMPNGLSITSGTGVIRFNFRGQPVDNTGTPLTANQAITINSAPPITITKETGLVP